jgi:hypothetical protein
VCVCVNKKPKKKREKSSAIILFPTSHCFPWCSFFLFPWLFFFAVYPARLQHHPHTPSSRRQGGILYGRIDIAAGIYVV